MLKRVSFVVLALISVNAPAFTQGWNVELLSSINDYWGNSNDIELIGNYAYMMTGVPGIRVVDISNPAIPIEVGYLDTEYSTNHSESTDGYLFIKTSDSGLRIIDISDPIDPVEVGNYGEFDVGEVEISDNY